MKKQREKFPDLNDLAFYGRNKSYGSFFLRKKYSRFLLVSFVIAILVLLLLTLVPLGFYYFQGPGLDFDKNEVFVVDYSFIPSPEDDLASLAKALATPQAPVEEQVPQVVDSVIPEKKKEPEEVKPEEVTDVKSDSAGSSQGQDPNGKGSADANGIYVTLDVYPRFPGGDQLRLYFLRTNIKYPSISLKSGVQGEVLVLFVVEPDGSITNVSVNKGFDKACEEEAMRVIKIMPRWEPGRRNGKSVRVLVKMPIIFKIPGRK
jgi:periplasmic protein TonB